MATPCRAASANTSSQRATMPARDPAMRPRGWASCARRQPVAVEAGLQTKPELSAKPLRGGGAGRAVNGISFDEITGHAMCVQRADQVADCLAAELPDASARRLAVSPRQISQPTVRFLEQQCGAGNRAATSDPAALPSAANATATSAPVMPPPTITTSHVRRPRNCGYVRRARVCVSQIGRPCRSVGTV
jgi:hypothetical protein